MHTGRFGARRLMMKPIRLKPIDLKHYDWQFSKSEIREIEQKALVYRHHGMDDDYPVGAYKERRGRKRFYVLLELDDRYRVEAAIRAGIKRVSVVLVPRPEPMIKLNPCNAIALNSIQRALRELTDMASMNRQDAKKLYRLFLLAVHPDKFDTTQMSEVVRTNWQLMMNGFSAVLESMHEQIARAEDVEKERARRIAAGLDADDWSTPIPEDELEANHEED